MQILTYPCAFSNCISEQISIHRCYISTVFLPGGASCDVLSLFSWQMFSHRDCRLNSSFCSFVSTYPPEPKYILKNHDKYFFIGFVCIAFREMNRYWGNQRFFWNKIKTEEITFVLKFHSHLTKPKCIELVGGILIIIYSLPRPFSRMFPTWLCCWKENACSTPPSTPWATAAAFSFICCCCCSLWNLRSAICCSLCCLWSFILSWIRRSSFSRSTFLIIHQSINQSKSRIQITNKP